MTHYEDGLLTRPGKENVIPLNLPGRTAGVLFRWLRKK
uniref:Uncharacterized protein n=1 Tax=Klebsiella pneumoniae subsp. pneumoniae TaxID=72407 RepID=A0A8F7KTI1_KLEPN|nr:hypothetical protein [Klebsiella pneumoniae subsp. pneumoniae]URZ92117.1 hypothetical protein [Klebsiella pneumoniae]QXV90617.1 hypothetical protein [Klebsiella pneumoniae subsp. pneumoniae]QXV91611.1 hypothetical protein [Klebsiella pneumoniae subsp. pneumoniae]URZ92689.1 hypothetical protein [Klebsiella pneumoniae]